MTKVEEELDLENFEGSFGRKFEPTSILEYWLKRSRFELEEI